MGGRTNRWLLPKAFWVLTAIALGLIATIAFSNGFALENTKVIRKTTTAPANSVTSKSIVNGTIQPIDISPNAIKAIHNQTGATGATGPPGPTGLTGLQGEQGDPGGPGPRGATGATGPPGDQGTPGQNSAKGDTGAPGALQFGVVQPTQELVMQSSYHNFTAQSPTLNSPLDSSEYPIFTLKFERDHTYTFWCEKTNQSTLAAGLNGSDSFGFEVVNRSVKNGFVDILSFSGPFFASGAQEIPFDIVESTSTQPQRPDDIMLTDRPGFWGPQQWAISCSYSETPSF
jgi:hypothetical protein